MFERRKFYHQYQIRFSKDLKKSLEGFKPEEQIQIYETLLNVVDCYAKIPIDYKGAQKLTDELRKTFGSRLLDFSNINPIEYLTEQSLKHIDLQYELKIENAGNEEHFFIEEERKNFLESVANQLILHKEMAALLIEPKENEQELRGTEKIKTKGKMKRERDDNVTRLNQEQTALLIYCLRKTKIILRDEYLNNKETGLAFSMLTGYSADTIRQNLNKSEMARIATPKNIEAVAKAIKDIQKFIEEEIKPEE